MAAMEKNRKQSYGCANKMIRAKDGSQHTTKKGGVYEADDPQLKLLSLILRWISKGRWEDNGRQDPGFKYP
jgi:hypothetical protein